MWQQILDFFVRLFDTSSWPPRWHCGEWTDFHGWLYIISDLTIWAAYFTLPFLLVSFVNRRKDMPFPRIFLLFGLFIFACGATHLMDAIIFWWPAYRLSALLRFATGVVSWATVFALIRVIPHALQLRTPTELEAIVRQRTAELEEANERLRRNYDDLEMKVTFRTLELEKEVRQLKEAQNRPAAPQA